MYRKKEIEITDNCFDILRIYACITVFAEHVFFWSKVSKPLFFLDGSFGVMIFFSLTGFLTMASYERHHQKGQYGFSRFLLGRIKRIYPPVLFSFLVVIFYDFFVLRINVFQKSILKYLFDYIVIYTEGSYKSGIGNGVVTWTLRVNFLFYILVPIIYRHKEKITKKIWATLIGGVRH